jgi:hypothetical protein
MPFQLAPKQIDEIAGLMPELHKEAREKFGAHGVGIGNRNAGQQAEDVIAYFVVRRVPNDKLRPEQVIPEFVSLSLPSGIVNVPTDVVETSLISFEQTTSWHPSGCRCQSHERPVNCGTCVSPKDSWWHGTLGALVMDPNLGKKHILSNAHVLAGFNQYKPGHTIVQPEKGEPLAKLTRAVEFQQNRPMTSDAAVAELLADSVNDTIDRIGHPRRGTTVVNKGDTVRKSGARTGLKSGLLRYIACTIHVQPVFTFRDVMIIDRISESGDSGSVLVNGTDHIVGLVFAGNDKFTAANPIHHVKTDLKIGDWEWVLTTAQA